MDNKRLPDMNNQLCPNNPDMSICSVIHQTIAINERLLKL